MRPYALRALAACLLSGAALLISTHGQPSPAKAGKFDEFTLGIGGPEYYRLRNYEEQDKELKLRFARYAKALRAAGARPYAITYGPRVVGWESYGRSVAGMRSGALWSYLTPLGFDGRQINWIDGGFRHEAATELWVVPPGAQPPCPTPEVRPEEVAYCPSVRVESTPYVPTPGARLRFKAVAESNDARSRPAYRWEVSRGQIVGGADTDTVEVELPPGASGEVVARVQVGGYSLECPAESAAAVGRTTVGVSHYKFDEFGDIPSGDTKARLDYLATTLESDPTLQVHLVVYAGRGGLRGQGQRRADWLRDYLVNTRGMEPGRIVTVLGGYRDELSGELWLSPRGTAPPAARPTVDESFVSPQRRRK